MSNEPIYVLQFAYETRINNFTVKHVLNCKVDTEDAVGTIPIGEPAGNINVNTSKIAGVTNYVSLEQFASDLIIAVLPKFSNETSFGSAVLIYYEFGTNNAGSYVSVVDMTNAVLFPNLIGTNVATGIESQMQTYVFYDSRGRTSKFVLQEVADNGRGIRNQAELQPEDLTIVQFLLGVDSGVRGAGNSFFTGFKNVGITQNEAIERKRYR